MALVARVTLAALLLTLSSAAQAISAPSWIITDEHLQFQAGSRWTETRSIASLTKLLTVMVSIDDGTATPELVKLAMVNSSNHAAYELCRRHSRGMRGCIRSMNDKAMSIDAWDTYVFEPTGLDRHNRSTARDLARIVLAASHYPQIVQASNIGQSREHKLVLRNTNPLVNVLHPRVSKTGWTLAAGGCLAMMVENRIYVVLGSANTHTRVKDLAELHARYSRPATVSE